MQAGRQARQARSRRQQAHAPARIGTSPKPFSSASNRPTPGPFFQVPTMAAEGASGWVGVHEQVSVGGGRHSRRRQRCTARAAGAGREQAAAGAAGKHKQPAGRTRLGVRGHRPIAGEGAEVVDARLVVQLRYNGRGAVQSGEARMSTQQGGTRLPLQEQAVRPDASPSRACIDRPTRRCHQAKPSAACAFQS